MTSLRELKAQFDAENAAPSGNINNLRRRVQMQRDALATAEQDLRIALGREGSPPELPDMPQPQPGGPRLSAAEAQATAAAIIRMGRIRRGELAPDAPPVQAAAEPPKTAQGVADTAAAILAAGKKRRGEKD